jgi:hypothetical protein
MGSATLDKTNYLDTLNKIWFRVIKEVRDLLSERMGTINVYTPSADNNVLALNGEEILYADVSNMTGTLTVRLPSTSRCRRPITVIKTDASANKVDVAAIGGQRINGAALQTLTAQYQFISVCSDGNDWFVVGRS